MSPPVDDAGDVDPADAFGALSDSLRVDILRALAAHHRETRGRNVLGFADLRRRVGVRDSGRFRYHLQKLRGRFVEKADGGYRLTHVGLQVVAAILQGTYTETVSMGPVELASDCSACGDPAVATYENGVCRVACADGHLLFQWNLPPSAAADTALPDLVSLAERLARHAIELSIAGTCPTCYAAVEPAVDLTDLDEEAAEPTPRFSAECDTCGGQVVGPVGFCLLVDPRVAAFYRRHGRALRECHVWEPSFVRDESATAVAATNPVRVEIDVTLDDETLRATLDDAGTVTAVESGSDST